MDNHKDGDISQCPFMGGTQKQTAGKGTSVRDFWPNELKLNILRQNAVASSPMAKDFDYATAFNSIDYAELKKDVLYFMTDSQDWWPADYGNYGPFMVRMAWHSAGTYRVGDGRGGARSGSQRFAPINSWPDNGNLDKARLLLWPIKKKYGNKLSWADLMILAGNCAMESMGFETFGFAGGREDVWEPEQDIYWGSETVMGENKERYAEGELEDPLGAVMMGWIYVNPEGPNGDPDPMGSAKDIRETFGRMAMNDEETVALVAGGHTFGKGHGAGPDDNVGPEPEGASMQEMGFGWTSSYESGKGSDTITSGFEGAWTSNPTQWDNGYFDLLFGYEWEQATTPAGAIVWHAIGQTEEDMAPDAEDSSKKVPTMMTTADIALREDPIYKDISKRFHENPEEFADAFARAWFKLLHRDMGPKARYLGPEVPEEELIWQDPVPAGDTSYDIESLKAKISESDLTIQEMVETAWASASTYRGSDMRGGANGSRIRLAPQNNWDANKPEQLSRVLNILNGIASESNVSLADTIVLAGAVGIEKAANASVPFTPGRGDASEEQTDEESFAVLEPVSDAFRNYHKSGTNIPSEEMMLDKAQLLGLTAPEMTVLVGGMRSLGISTDGLGVFTNNANELSNDFFETLLDMSVQWKPNGTGNSYEATDRISGEKVRTASRSDLVFGSNSQLRAIAEVYASSDAKDKFISDFISAWNKVMNADLVS